MSPPPPAAESTTPAKPVIQIKKSIIGPLTVMGCISLFPPKAVFHSASVSHKRPSQARIWSRIIRLTLAP